MPRKPLLECLRGGQVYLLDVPRAEASYTARKSYEVVDRMAIIDVSGVLVSDAGWWDGWGVSGYRRIAGELLGAVEADDVDGVLLRIDSPGGETDGAFELAEAVSAAAKRKPMWAIADVSAYSAAYLIASQSGRIVAAPESGGLGSIGVYAMHVDYSAYLKEAGIRPTFITAGEGKTDGNPYEPLSRGARERMQAEVDRLYDAFVGAVARGRGLAESVIKNEFGARTYHGAEALIEMGLADASGTFEDVLQEFRSHLDDRKAKSGPTSFAAAFAAKHHEKESDMAALKGSQAAKASASEQQEVNPAEGTTGNTEEKKEETTETTTVAPEGDASAAAYERGYAAAMEVVALCALAKAPGRALGFLKSGAKPAAVRTALLDESAGDGSDEVVGHVVAATSAEDMAGARASKAETKPSETLLAAMSRLGNKGVS